MMKPKSKVMDSDKKTRTQNQNEHRESRRKIWLRVAAIFVAIAFLASECATLLPIE
jgi:preprotein translocase subunit Sec63